MLVAMIAAAAALPSVAQLAGAHFQDVELVKKVRAGKYDPRDYSDWNPTAAHFIAPGRVELDFGQEGATCDFTVAGREGQTELLDLHCNLGEHTRRVRWTWIDAERVTTDIARGEQTELWRLDETRKERDAKFEQRFHDQHLPKLAGTWRAGEERLQIRADGPARVVPCLAYEKDVEKRVACVRLGERGLVVRSDGTLEEGDLGGLEFQDDSNGGRRFRRVR
jgi:hypothetical protein